MSYWKWMLKEGWKKYALPFVLIGFVECWVVRGRYDILSMPIWGICIVAIPILGAPIGMVYHSIVIWKNNKDNKPDSNQPAL